MVKIQLNFYEELTNIEAPANLNDFRTKLSKLYNIDMTDAEELIVYYLVNGIKNFIHNENDYNNLKAYLQMNISGNNSEILKINLEVNENSKLFLKEVGASQFNESTQSYVISECGSVVSESEKLLNEIREKEKLLKELQLKEKERLERANEEKAARERFEAEERLRKEQEELLEAQRLEEEQRAETDLQAIIKAEEERADLIAKIRKSCTEAVSANFENIKQELIEKSINQTLEKVEGVEHQSKKENISFNPEKVVHRGFSCNVCNVFPIVGTRYRCTVCYDYDMCETCEARDGDSHQHSMVKHRVEQQRGFGCPYRRDRKFGAGGCTRNQAKPNFFEELAKKAETFIGGLGNNANFKDLINNFQKFNGCKDTKSSETKVEEPSIEVPVQENKVDKVKEVRERFVFGDLSDSEIQEALDFAHGNVDAALENLASHFWTKKN